MGLRLQSSQSNRGWHDYQAFDSRADSRSLAVSEILCVDRVYSVSLFGISELIPKISNQIGWQIG